MSRGFTLIEIILYFSLFALIMSGSLSSFYYFSEANQKLSLGVASLNQGEFILSKINWLLNDLEALQEPRENQTSEKLRLIKNNSQFLLYEEQGVFFLENQNQKNPLNNEDLKIENLIFENRDLTGSGKFFALIAAFGIQDQEFKTLKFYYAR